MTKKTYYLDSLESIKQGMLWYLRKVGLLHMLVSQKPEKMQKFGFRLMILRFSVKHLTKLHNGTSWMEKISIVYDQV